MLPVIIGALYYLLLLIQYAIIARAIISWFPISKENPIIRILNLVTDPIIAPIRRLMEKSGLAKNSMFDFSPLVAFLLIGLLINIIF